MINNITCPLKIQYKVIQLNVSGISIFNRLAKKALKKRAAMVRYPRRTIRQYHCR